MKCLFFLCVASVALTSEIDAVKRVYAHLLIHNDSLALSECKHYLKSYPHSEELKRAYLKALVRNEKEGEALSYFKMLKEPEKERSLIETLAWGVMNRFESSPQIVVSQSALMGACSIQDVRGVEMIVRKLDSSNAFLRWTAAHCASYYRDRSLIQTLRQLLISENVWFVRLEVIRTLGTIGAKEVKESLKYVIDNPRTTAEEKREAMTALVAIYHEVEDEELKECLNSSRSGLRHLACEIIGHLNLKEKEAYLVPLLDDPSSDVRIAAINALSFLGLKTAHPSILVKMAQLMDDVRPSIALTAAWASVRYLPEEAFKVINKWLHSSDKENQRLAAHVLGKTGLAGNPLIETVIRSSFDPFVKANVALGAIGQGFPNQKLIEILDPFLKETQQKVMWSAADNPLFVLLVPSKVSHVPDMARYPIIIDKLSRLKLLKMLALLKHPQALELIKNFLKEDFEDCFEVIHEAASTLFEEGDQEVIDILHLLLQEENQTVQIQAAMILALKTKQVEAINRLHEMYCVADRDKKEAILNVLGCVGSQESVPFLINVLDEPHQLLKVIGASALLQWVYR